MTVPLVAPPRETGLPLDGLDSDNVGVRTFEIEAAVGLLKRSAEVLLKVTFLTGEGTGGAALRIFAREAAVGAKSPEDEDGVFGRDTPVEDGVLGRDTEEGVLGRLGVEDIGFLICLAGVDAVDLVDVPVC